MKFLFLLFTTTLTLSIINSMPAKALHVVVDAGHGGIDAGAVRGTLRESDLVLDVAKRLRERIQSDPRFKVTMTREENKSLSLKERVQIANSLKADLFLSLHANAADDTRAKGLEFFIQNTAQSDEPLSYFSHIENQVVDDNPSYVQTLEPSKKGDLINIVEDLQKQSRLHSSLKASKIFHNKVTPEHPSAIKQAPFFVISRTQMPSVLVEIGFISNPLEAKKLNDTSYRSEIVEKIFVALQDYKEKVDKSLPSPLQ
ncbi:MAG: N-acetylmuramoyl-L-alanine amidase [Bdellovibrionia bacterium]